MFDIDLVNEGDRVKLISEGEEYIGMLLEFDWNDGPSCECTGVTVEMDSGVIFNFDVSEIESIEVL